MSTPHEIAEGINLLKVAYPNYQPDVKRTADLWLLVLGDLPGETLKAAILERVTELGRAFAPSVGEIREAAIRLNALAAGIPDAYRAYDEVVNMPADMLERELVEENGQNFILTKKLKFSHPLVETVATLIGWPKTFPTDMPAADRSQFVKAYEAELARSLSDGARLPKIKQYIAEAGNGRALPEIARAARQLGAGNGN